MLCWHLREIRQSLCLYEREILGMFPLHLVKMRCDTGIGFRHTFYYIEVSLPVCPYLHIGNMSPDIFPDKLLHSLLVSAQAMDFV